MDHYGLLQVLRHRFSALLVDLDQLQVHVRVLFLHRAREIEADVAAAHHDHPAGRLSLVPKGGHGAQQVAAVRDEVDIVTGFQFVFRGGHEAFSVPLDTNDHDVQVREQVCQLAQGRVEDRCLLVTAHADQSDLAIGQCDRVKGPGNLQPPLDRLGDLQLRRDDVVDRHMIA